MSQYSKAAVCVQCGQRLRLRPAPTDPRVAVIGIRFAWQCSKCEAAVCPDCSIAAYQTTKPKRVTCPNCNKKTNPKFFLSKSLPGEEVEAALEVYIAKLVDIYRQHETYLLDAEAETREIGSEIYNQYEHIGMDYTCDEVRDRLGGRSARSLEMAWNGIGEWWG